MLKLFKKTEVVKKEKRIYRKRERENTEKTQQSILLTKKENELMINLLERADNMDLKIKRPDIARAGLEALDDLDDKTLKALLLGTGYAKEKIAA